MHRSLVLLVLLCPLLSGCLGKATASRGAVEIRHCFFGSYEEWRLWQTIKREFELQNPDIRVKLLYWPGANYEDKLKVVMAGGIPPDVIVAQDEPLPAYCMRGQFEDLTDRIRNAGEALARSKYFPTSFEAFQWQGRQMAFPWNGGMLMVYFNRSLFRKAGLTDPARDWTWDDFLRACRRITRDDDGDGRTDRFGFELTTWWVNVQPFLWSAGGEVLDETMQRCVLNSREAVNGLQWYRDLRYKHHVCPRPNEMTGMGENVQFMTGRLGMLISGPWNLPFMRQTDIDWDIAHPPIGPKGRFTRGTWDGLAIARASRHKDAAWRFIQFVVGPRGQYHIAATGRAIPPLRSQARVFLRPDTPQHEERFVEALEMGYVRASDIDDHWNELDVIYRQEFDRLLLNRQGAQRTVAVLEKKTNALLADHRSRSGA